MSGDYYDILGIPRTADGEQIKKAYKAKALEYHPDRNPGDHDSEEKFKMVNEAYQVLSDPVARSKYNHKLEYADLMSGQRNEPTYRYNPAQYYRPPQPRTKTSAYRIDKEYYKVQKILIIIFLGLIGSAYGLNLFKKYRIEQEKEERILANQMLLDSAFTAYQQDQFDSAFSMIDRLIEDNVTQFNYYVQRDSLILDMRDRAFASFQAENYEQAAFLFDALRSNEWRERTSTLELLSTSYARAGNGRKAANLLIDKLKEEPNNIALLYYTALLHYEELRDARAALPFLTRAKGLFKSNNTKMYGKAFEFVLKPKNVPEVYFSVYNLSSELNFMTGNHLESYTDCNWAIWMRPEHIELYERRIESGIRTNQTARICRDLNMISTLGGDPDKSMVNKYCNY